ncbi:MAG TPA: hypothetical protein VEX41_05935, partial [Candidatus Eisenbacteria bacterium]|nr:hypothetical protein [Candidatus Eisenbacteria bacterium]
MVPQHAHRVGARILPLLAALLLLAACNPTGLPSPSPTSSATPTQRATPAPSESTPGPGGSVDPVYGAIAAQVEQIRGLHPTADIAPVVIDQATLRRN